VNSKHLLLALLLWSVGTFSQQAQKPNTRSAFDRPAVDILREIEYSRFCGDIVVRAYSVQVNSIWVLDKLSASRLDIPGSIIFPNFHGTLPVNETTKPYWPKVGDTCFVVLDRDNVATISVFGIAKGDNYIFWDPYSKPGESSFFVFDRPFENHPTELDENELGLSQKIAFKSNRQFANAGYCVISKKDFWKIFYESRRAGKGGC
jgi:hypothetical protein